MDDTETPFVMRLPKRAFEKLIRALENPPEPNEALIRLMTEPGVWEDAPTAKGEDNGTP
jgi:uncharacterized protein (DUF1778 family)